MTTQTDSAYRQQLDQVNRNEQTAVSNDLAQLLQQSANQIQQSIECAAVLFFVEDRNQLLILSGCALNLPSAQYPPILCPDLWHQQSPNGQYNKVAQIDPNKRSHRRNLAVRIFHLAAQTDKKDPHFIANDMAEAFCPLLSQDEAHRLQQQLQAEQIIALPLVGQDKRPLGAMLVALSRRLHRVDYQYLIALSQQTAATICHKRHLNAMSNLEDITLKMQGHMSDETEILQTIVDAVVYQLGYAGAMVATLEDGHALPLRAYTVDVSPSLIQILEKRAGKSLIGEQSVVYLDNPYFKDNLSVRAVRAYQKQGERFLLSDQLYDLLRPFANQYLCDFIQGVLSIKQVLALPFFIKDKMVGNLFVLSRSATFSPNELTILTSFSQQAAVGLHNARLYRRTEEQRQIAEMFGRMAFGATASIHKLRNQIGAARTYLHLLESLSDVPAEKLHSLLSEVPMITGRLDQAADLLDSLHQPWHHIPDEPVNVNTCLLRALRDIFPLTSFKPIDAQVKTEEDIIVLMNLSSEMPMVETTADMLAEAFRIILKNGVEALDEGSQSPRGRLFVSSIWSADTGVVVTLRDDGRGIQPAHLSRIFDLGWSTKKGQGMGFGLFWAKDYIEGLGGQIDVTSRIDEGTTFTLTLPATVSWEQQMVGLA